MSMSLRVSEAWLTSLDTLNERLLSVFPENRSLLIRELVNREAFLWLQAPYFVEEAEKFVFVAANGDMFLYSMESLRFQKGRHAVPCRISMKQEKELEYERLYSDQVDFGAKIREQWLINHFAIFGNSPEDRVEHVDRHGITSKSADLVVDVPQGVARKREIIIGNREYVQRDEGHDTTADRASVSIDVPTLNLTAAVLVDSALYAENSSKRRTSQIEYELRNNEMALMQSTIFPSEACASQWHSGHFPGTLRRLEADRQDVLRLFRRFRHRTRHLSKPDVLFDDQPVVPSEDARARLALIDEPDEYLFGVLRWPLPLTGITVGLTWTKPD